MKLHYAFRLVLLSAVACVGCTRPGQMYLKATIELDGKEVLNVGYGVSDSSGKDVAFKELEGRAFQPQNNWKPDAGSTQELVLKGKIHLKLLHVQRVITLVDITELKLVPDTKNAGSWKLAPGEVDRLGKLIK